MVRSSEAKKVRLDSKGRISLGKFVPEGVTGFEVFEQEDGSLVLSPTVEIPAREAWLFKNKKAFASVKRGLKQAGEGKTTKESVNFEKHLDSDD